VVDIYKDMGSSFEAFAATAGGGGGAGGAEGFQNGTI